MYQSETERDEKEYLNGYSQQPVQPVDYNYLHNSSYAPAQLQHPLYPQAQAQTQPAQGQFQAQAHYAGNMNSAVPPSAFGTSNANAFDNVDISRGGRLSGSTPFGTVHEFVSVSNKVFSRSFLNLFIVIF